MKIVVLANGFVLVCRTYAIIDDHIHMTSVRCIRAWGTAQGLGQLVNGPTSGTKLDATIPVVAAPLHSLVFNFDIVERAWASHI
jgi:hypothetical protein